MEFNADKYKIFDNILKNENYQNDEIIEIIGKALSVCSPFVWEKIDKILLSIITSNEEELKKECYNGIPDYLPSLRALIWKINLRYLSHDIKKWKSSLDLKRNEYLEIKKAFILRKKEEIKIFEEIENEKKMKEEKKKENNSEEEEKNNIDEKKIKQDDNKNNKNNKEEFLIYLGQCTDKNLLELINKDINRTRVDMNFFNSLANKDNKMTKEEQMKMLSFKNNCIYPNYKNVYIKGRDKITVFENETHCDIIERILYIYSKLNKDVGYVQGMNELIAPIYYCFCKDSNVNIENVEADTFWCFSLLMKDLKKLFLKENDVLKGGILDRIYLLDLIISKIIKDIYKTLLKKNVSTINYAISWVNLLFCQDLMMPDILRLWDIIFSEKDRLCFVYYFSMAILQYKKKKIEDKTKDFSDLLIEIKSLQNENIEKIIDLAVKLKKNYEKKVNGIILDFDKKENKSKEIISKCQDSINKAK